MSVPRNSPCPCGSGKKYKNCCFKKNYIEVSAQRKDVELSLNEHDKIKTKITDKNSIPVHNRNGLKPKITKSQIIDLCLDEIYNSLQIEKVGMLVDLVNAAIATMDVVPVFTHDELATQMEKDDRFSIYMRQICSLSGTNPVELMVDRLS